jgi:EAL domain-containing protein (putative c-di-GMP-specific phosphodiesterase class I)
MIGAGNEQAELELENAVLALDQARIRSKTVVHWEPASSEDPKLKLAMLNDIITGIDRNEFAVVYQPKYSVHEGEFTDLEALIRWNHRRFGFISPSSFIATAEETGAIDPLTLWVAGQVIRDQAYMRSNGVDVAIAINVSGKSICDLEFCDRLLKLITSTNARISIEITETAVIEHPELAIQGIERFQKSGVRLSIDDYGAGQSSLVYLKTLEAHELKLDRSMILDVTSSQRDRLILKSTIDLAHALDMEVVCEGVEDEATFKVLEALGFDKFQGFYFARPMSLEGALELFKSQSGSLQKLRKAVS